MINSWSDQCWTSQARGGDGLLRVPQEPLISAVRRSTALLDGTVRSIERIDHV